MLALAASVFTGSLSASTVISGQFDLDGSLTATVDTITWVSDANVPDQANIGTLGLTGSFVGLGGTLVDIHDLDRATEPVNTPFSSQDFIDFLSAPDFPSLLVQFIPAGDGGSSDCTMAPVAGQTCTPDVPGGSPFTFVNTQVTLANGSNAIYSSATFDFSGVTSDGLGTWSGIFTSQFTEPFQTVLADLGTPGFSVSNTYSGTNVVITLTQIPEPGALTLMAVGLVLLAAGRVRLRRS
jgi:hypothetical protein